MDSNILYINSNNYIASILPFCYVLILFGLCTWTYKNLSMVFLYQLNALNMCWRALLRNSPSFHYHHSLPNSSLSMQGKDFKLKPRIFQLIWSLSEIYQCLCSQLCRMHVNGSAQEVCKKLGVLYGHASIQRLSVAEARSNNYTVRPQSHFDSNKIRFRQRVPSEGLRKS